MREIKYKAWIESLKVMADVLVIDFEDEKVLLKGYKRDTWATFNQVALLEYTGQKDINGVEIYEGDVVKGIARFGSEVVGDISYNEYNLTYDVVDNQLFEGYLLSNLVEIERLGNVYENPELLEVD